MFASGGPSHVFQAAETESRKLQGAEEAGGLGGGG